MKPIEPFLMFLETLRLHGLETAAHRFYSVYQATVDSLDDPLRLGRVKVTVTLTSDHTLPEYAYPISAFGGAGCGLFFPPRVGDQGYVVFECGDQKYPLYVGGSWAAPKGQSQVPDEVGPPVLPKLGPVAGTAAQAEYTARVIKTPMGMLLKFEDGDAAGARDKGIVLATSEATESGGPFTKLHQLLMSDKQGLIELRSAGIPTGTSRYRLVLNDTGKSAFIEAGSGALVAIEDNAALQRLRMLSKNGHLLILDDKHEVIRLDSANSNVIEIDDKTNRISAQTIGGRNVSIDDATQMISITDPQGNLVTIGPTGIQVTSATMVNVTAAGAATVTAGGPVAVTGAGIAETSTGGGAMSTLNTGVASGLMLGGVLSTILGLVAMTLLGGATLTVIGTLLIAATSLTIACNSIALGPGVQHQLVTDQLLVWLATHTHPTAAPGAPSPPTEAPLISGPAAQSYMTQHVTAS